MQDDLATRLASIEHEIIEYKSSCVSIADSTPLYRETISFPAFSPSNPTIRHYTIKLIFDTNPILMRPFVYAYDSPTLERDQLEYYGLTGVSLANTNTVRTTQYYDSAIAITIFSTAELKGYEASYEDEQVGVF